MASRDRPQADEKNLCLKKVNSNGGRGTYVVLQKTIDDSTCEFSERTFVNLSTENNINFTKGCIVQRTYITQAVSPHSTPRKVQRTDKIARVQLEQTIRLIEYVVEFATACPKNFTVVALGGKSPEEFSWSLELEQFSTFSYSVMRQNVF